MLFTVLSTHKLRGSVADVDSLWSTSARVWCWRVQLEEMRARWGTPHRPFLGVDMHPREEPSITGPIQAPNICSGALPTSGLTQILPTVRYVLRPSRHCDTSTTSMTEFLFTNRKILGPFEKNHQYGQHFQDARHVVKTSQINSRNWTAGLENFHQDFPILI